MATQYNPNNPRSTFYWNDWENEPSLKLCSLAAQGFWMRLLCIAAKCEPFGYLTVNRRALNLDDLSTMTGRPAAELSPLLHELEMNGVFSRDAKGRIYCRRMVRDARQSAIAQKNGKKGGNPSLGKQTEKAAGDNPPVKAGDNPNTLSLSNNTPLPPKGGWRRSREEKQDGDAVWNRRVSGFYDRGFWLSAWGPRPDEGEECLAPVEIINQFQRRSA